MDTYTANENDYECEGYESLSVQIISGPEWSNGSRYPKKMECLDKCSKKGDVDYYWCYMHKPNTKPKKLIWDYCTPCKSRGTFQLWTKLCILLKHFYCLLDLTKTTCCYTEELNELKMDSEEKTGE